MNSVRMQTGCLLAASLILGALVALSVHPWPAVAVTGTAGFQPAAVVVPSPSAVSRSPLRSAARERVQTACGLRGEDAVAVPSPLADQGALRRAKCRALWQAVAPWSYSPYLSDYFITEHERLGIGHEWFASFVYGFANFGLVCNKRVGPCFGPMDVRFEYYARRAGCRCADDLRDPRRNIRAHCLEARVGADRGYSGLALCRYIMYPARPHDWGGGRFRNTWTRLETVIARQYAAGKVVVDH